MDGNSGRQGASGALGRLAARLSVAALVGAYPLLGAPLAGGERPPPNATTSSASPQASPPQAVITTLSNLTTLSRWTYPQSAAAAHQNPSARSHVVGHLEFLTGDGQAAVTSSCAQRRSAVDVGTAAAPGSPKRHHRMGAHKRPRRSACHRRVPACRPREPARNSVQGWQRDLGAPGATGAPAYRRPAGTST